MGEYTEQEIEMLARFENEVDGGDIAGQRFYVCKALDGWSAPWATRIRAALRLMREAREQGAAEMRERAAQRVFDDFRALESFDRDTASDLFDGVLCLPLKVPQ